MRTLRRRWIDIIGLLVALGAAAGMMYTFLPDLTQPGQRVVPSLSASASDPLQSFLTIFIVMTTVGAPVTMAIVLMIVMPWLSKQLPASSAAAEAAAKATKSAAKPAPDRAVKPLSAREETFWKIAATMLTLLIAGGVTAAVWPDLVRLFSR